MAKVTDSEQHFGLNYIATGEHTDGRYFQCSTSVPPGERGPPAHKHANESEGFYVMSGSLKLIVDGNEHALNAGDFFNVMPEVAHTWSNESSSTTELMIVFSPSGIEEMFRELDVSDADYVAIGIKYGMTMVG